MSNVIKGLIAALLVGGIVVAAVIIYSGQQEAEQALPGPTSESAQPEPSESEAESPPGGGTEPEPGTVPPKGTGEEGERIYGEALSEQDRNAARSAAVRFTSAFWRDHESEGAYEASVFPLLTDYQRDLIKTVDYRLIPPFDVQESKIYSTGTSDALVDVVTSGGVVRVYVVKQGDQWLVQEYGLR